LALIVTDGEAVDNDEFVQILEREGPKVYCLIALLGYGPEHQRAIQKYQQIAQYNSRVRLINFNDETDPYQIANGLLNFIL